MPSFQFKAVTSTGQIISNTLEAPSEAAASKELAQKGYRPISLKAVGGKAAGAAGAATGTGMNMEIKLFAPKVKGDEIIMFTRQLVTLLRAGVPMLTALEALRDQSGKTFSPRRYKASTRFAAPPEHKASHRLAAVAPDGSATV